MRHVVHPNITAFALVQLFSAVCIRYIDLITTKSCEIPN